MKIFSIHHGHRHGYSEGAIVIHFTVVETAGTGSTRSQDKKVFVKQNISWSSSAKRLLFISGCGAMCNCVRQFEQFLFAEQFKCGAVSDCVEIEAAQSGLSYLFIAFKSNSLTFAVINLSFILPYFKSVFFFHLNLR